MTSLLAVVSLVEVTEFIIVILRGEALDIELPPASLIVLTAGSAETACASLVVPTSTAS